MARKNAEIVKKLPRVVPEPGAWRDEVVSQKETVTDRTPAALAAEYERLRDKRDLCDERYKRAMRKTNARIEAIEELIPAAFEAATVESLKTTGGHRVGVSPSIASQVVDNDKLIAWAKANGYERKLTLYAPTVLAIVKERLTEGQTLPDGVEARGFDKVTFTR